MDMPQPRNVKDLITAADAAAKSSDNEHDKQFYADLARKVMNDNHASEHQAYALKDRVATAAALESAPKTTEIEKL